MTFGYRGMSEWRQQKKKEGQVCLIGNLLWQVGKKRSEGLFGGVKRQPMVDINKVVHEWEEYR